MKRTNRQLKYMAKNVLRGNYTIPILANIVINALSAAAGSMTSALFPATSGMSTVLSQIFSFIITVIFSLFTAGLIYMYLNISRRRPHSFTDLIYLFSHNPDRILIVGFVLALINAIISIPSVIADRFLFTDDVMNGDITAMLQYLYTTLFFLIITLAVYTVITLPLTFSYALMIDHPDLPAKEAIKTSIRLMKGNYWRYLKLLISFIPLYILSVFTCYIALLWVVPYQGITEIFLYRELTGDLDTENSSEGSIFSGQIPYSPENNDYNSEA